MVQDGAVLAPRHARRHEDAEVSHLLVQQIDDTLAGSYQILGFMDIDGNADPANPQPDEGDPVMIPIGGFELSCAVQPVTAEFAIVLPPGVN